MTNKEYSAGIVKSWDQESGAGFIADDLGNDVLHFSRKSLRNPFSIFTEDQRVLYRINHLEEGSQIQDVHAEDTTNCDPFEINEQRNGLVEKVNNDRGFGFIKVDDGTTAWFHVTYQKDSKELYPEGTPVIFTLVTSDKGLQAKEIQLKVVLKEETQKKHEDYLAAAILARYSRDLENAAQLYKKGMENSPSVQLITSYAAMEKNRNRKSAAMQIYEAGIKKHPRNTKLYCDAGRLAASMGRYKKALELMQHAIALFEEKHQEPDKGVLLTLANIFYELSSREDLEKAIKYFSELESRGYSLARSSKDDFIRYNLAKIRCQHYRGKLTYEFLGKAGFPIVHAELMGLITVGADFIIKITNSELLESYGFSDNIFIRCMFKSEVSRQDIEEMDARILSLGSAGLADEQVAIIIVSSLSDSLQRTLFKRIENRSRLVPAIIPVSQSLIEREADPISLLRSILDQWLYRRDLFLLNSPVVGRRFFGRDKPLAELRDTILSGTPAGIFGLRKVGKTSLLKETERRSHEAGDIVVYMDLLRLPSDINDTKWLYWKWATLLFDRCNGFAFKGMRWRLGGVFKDFFEIPKDFSVATAFDADITEVLNRIKASNIQPRPKVILMLDEVEVLFPSALGREGLKGFFDFFSYLRGLSQETDDFVVIITGANAAISEVSHFDNRDNPVFNFFKEIYLQLLEPHETTFMIKSLGNGMGLRFSDMACSMVHSLTGGHPFFTRKFCSFIGSSHSERPLIIKPETVAELAEPYIEFSGKDFEEIFDRLSRDYPQEKDFCIDVAKSEEIVYLESIVKKRTFVDVSLRHLVGYQILKIENGEVAISMQLFRRWLQRRYLGDK